MTEAERVSPPNAYRARFVRLLKDRWAIGVVFMSLLAVIDAAHAFAVRVYGENLLGLFDPAYTSIWANSAVTAPMVFFAVLAVDALELTGTRRAVAMVVAVVAATAASLGILASWSVIITPSATSFVSYVSSSLWMYAVCGLVLAAYLTVRDREAAAARQAQEAQMARVRTERATMGARLKVMQARVEPELLFGALTEVRALYLRAPAEAEALLDNLIDYLRAALPQMRGESSTLRKEAELAAVYLKVVPTGRSGHLAVELKIDDEVGGIAFPPMFLLPLVHDAAESGATRIRLAAQVDSTSPTRVTIAVEASPRAQWTSERIADLRRVAQRYLGEGARLEVHDISHGTHARLAFHAPENVNAATASS